MITRPRPKATSSELSAFIAEVRPGLVRSLRLICNEPGIAEELAQEALARAVARSSALARMDRPDLWVQRVAVNLARSWIRRRIAERKALSKVGARAEIDEPRWPVDLELHAALGALSRRQREVLSLVYLQDLSIPDAAAVLGIAPGTAKSHLARGLAQLRQVLEHEEEQ